MYLTMFCVDGHKNKPAPCRRFDEVSKSGALITPLKLSAKPFFLNATKLCIVKHE